MKTFKEFYEEKELNEEVGLATLASIFGFVTVVPFTAWAASLIVSAYAKGIKRIIKEIRMHWKRVFKGEQTKTPKQSELNKIVQNMKFDTKVKRYDNMDENFENQYKEELNDVFEAIKEKNEDATLEAFKNLDKTLRNSSDVKRILMKKITETFEAPPIHFGNTGNETYKFIKKVFGIQSARAAATGVQKALKKYGDMFFEKEQ